MRYPDTPGIYASTIAKRAQVSRAAVSRQLQQMENRGWILRSTDPNSKRSVFVKLTDAGIAVVQQQYASEEQLFQRAFARVGEQRVAEAFGVLDEMMAALETESKALPDSSQTIQGKGVCK
jgi:DNA-binding MarR family transcriptional regulator